MRSIFEKTMFYGLVYHVQKYKKILFFIVLLLLPFTVWFSVHALVEYQETSHAQALLDAAEAAQKQAIEDIINSRRLVETEGEVVNPLGEDGLVRILLIGIDSRAGQQQGHCDAIQLLTISTSTPGSIEITAVPRGTYSPLPPGKGATSSDYYVSNACGLGGLDYGIEQIEKILGVKSDYLVVVGFSETLGILRYLRLPTTETLQWLRNRQGYKIGEPQRAHNHSTFLKQMLVRFAPGTNLILDKPLQYLVYRLVKTDLSFGQTQLLASALAEMDLANHPEKIRLSMRPFYTVQDIAYDPEQVDEYLEKNLGPIRHLFTEANYSKMSVEEIQMKLIRIVEENKDNAEFVTWAYDNNLWLQIEDTEKSLAMQYDLLIRLLSQFTQKTDRQALLADYILEMENRNQTDWQNKGQALLIEEIARP